MAWAIVAEASLNQPDRMVYDRPIHAARTQFNGRDFLRAVQGLRVGRIQSRDGRNIDPTR